MTATSLRRCAGRPGPARHHGAMRRPSPSLTAPRLAATVLATALLALVATGCGSSDDGAVDTEPDATTTTTVETTTSSSTTTSVPADDALGLWPPADEGTVGDPVALAQDFAERFLGIAGAVAAPPPSELAEGGGIEVTSGDQGPATVVAVARAGDGGFVVTAATAPTIEVDEPADGATLTSPVALGGRANAFEGNVVVQLRPAATLDGPLGETFVTGAQGELGPFAGELTFSGGAAGDRVAVVFYAPDESGAGTAVAATVVPARLG